MFLNQKNKKGNNFYLRSQVQAIFKTNYIQKVIPKKKRKKGILVALLSQKNKLFLLTILDLSYSE
jgi:hypothetical protein